MKGKKSWRIVQKWKKAIFIYAILAASSFRLKRHAHVVQKERRHVQFHCSVAGRIWLKNSWCITELDRKDLLCEKALILRGFQHHRGPSFLHDSGLILSAVAPISWSTPSIMRSRKGVLRWPTSRTWLLYISLLSRPWACLWAHRKPASGDKQFAR